MSDCADQRYPHPCGDCVPCLRERLQHAHAGIAKLRAVADAARAYVGGVLTDRYSNCCDCHNDASHCRCPELPALRGALDALEEPTERMQVAAAEAVAEHHRSGRSVPIMKDGSVVMVGPEDALEEP